jgi:hypothetical protein
MAQIALYSALPGILVGFVSGLLFQWGSSRIPRVEFWSPAVNLARSLVTLGDDDLFLSHYGQLLRLLVRYLGRQFLTMALPVVTVGLFFLLILPPLSHGSEGSQAQPSRASSPAMLIGDQIGLRKSDLVAAALLSVGFGAAFLVWRSRA